MPKSFFLEGIFWYILLSGFLQVFSCGLDECELVLQQSPKYVLGINLLQCLKLPYKICKL